MQLTITRSQKKAGMISKEIVFMLTVKSELTEEEKFAVQEYNLGKMVIYNSENSRKHIDNIGSGGLLKAATSLAMSKMSLNISIGSLMRGQTLECKSLDEVLSAEDAIREACENMKQYIKVAANFNGSTETIEF